MKQFNRFIDPKKGFGKLFRDGLPLSLGHGLCQHHFNLCHYPLYVWTVWIGDGREAGVCRKKIINGNGISYLISVSIGVLLFALYRQGSLFKGDVRQKGRKMTWQTFLVFIAFLGFAQLASSALSQLLDP